MTSKKAPSPAGEGVVASRSMLPRVLEPEVMDTREEAFEYDTMDHSAVNTLFVDDLIGLLGSERGGGWALDVGTGTALIPIEACQRLAKLGILAIDASRPMLELGARRLRERGLTRRIHLAQVDAKQLPCGDGTVDLVISNSIVHHIAEPEEVIREMLRVLGPGGGLLVRDLCRPASAAVVDELVATYAEGASETQRELFRASLHAALTVGEMRDIVSSFGLSGDGVQQTSDRHWTWQIAPS